jgi:magnesium transporter
MNMGRFIKNWSKKVGRAPGTLIADKKKSTIPAPISVIDYSGKKKNTTENVSPAALRPYRDSASVTWINVTGVHDIAVLKSIGDAFDLHPLLLEDVAHTDQRPKIEEYENGLFIILKMLTYDEQKKKIATEQISLVLGKKWVLVFQEKPGDVFDPIRNRVEKPGSLLRKNKADFLAYRIIDTIIDHYFVILESIGEEIEDLESRILKNPQPVNAQEIHRLKRELVFLRKSVWPVREILSTLHRNESPFIQQTTQPYIRDAYDHTIQVIDTIETFRDLGSGLLDMYLSVISNRMNEVMKVLTIIATIFIPLTFIAGIYGMNFQHMPELGWAYGYPAILGMMVLIGVGMVVFFRKKGWLS